MKKKLKMFLTWLLVYCVIVGFYIFVTPGISEHAIGLHMRRFVPAALAMCLPSFLFKEFSLSNYKFELLLAVLSMTVAPAIALIFASKNKLLPASLPYDIAFGAYLFCVLCFAKIFIVKYCYNIPAKLVYYGIQFLLFLLPAFQIIYFLIFWHPVSTNSLLVILQTNPAEAAEYLKSLQWEYQLAGGAVLLFGAAWVIVNAIRFRGLALNYTSGKKKLGFAAVVCLGLFCYSFFSLLPRSYFVCTALDVNYYFKACKNYKAYHQELLQNLQVQASNNAAADTIILVIGESATRNYMQAFNNGMEPTTPWLSAHREQFLLFNNAYACAWNTVPALEHALTEANYYNKLEFAKAASILDIAKKAGYKTYWFSNQGKIGVFDTPITLVAETADVAEWTEQSCYDEKLLDYLHRLDKNKKNFVVLHIMGSHIDYNNRYPEKYQIWTDPGVTGRVADYKNSLVYTDKVLQQVFDYANTNLNMAAFIYLSDHGTDPNRSRDPDESKFLALRIPLFIYLADSYKEQYPETVAALAAHQQQFFSNDLLYNLVCGILQVKSNHYNEEESIASSKYKFTINNTKAGMGKKQVKDDPYLQNYAGR